MKRPKLAAIMVAIVWVLGCGRDAFAQEPRFEASILYGWEDDGGFHLPVGWVVSAAGYITPQFALVAEAGGQYDFERVPNLPGFTYANTPYNINYHTFSGGARVSTSRTAALSAFGQVLVGAHRVAGIPDAPFDWRQWSLLLQPGGGVSVRVSRGLAV